MADKLKEHYGITLSASAAAVITERHAQSLQEKDTLPAQTSRIAPLTLIAEVDGSMIPVVATGNPDTPGADKRKHRAVQWKEARLSLVRRPDEVEPTFAVTLGDTTAAGATLMQLAGAAGLTGHTRVHAIGDGAPWIAEQVEVQFGARGSYLIDLYHLCEYLACAAPSCDADPAAWVARQKEQLKAGALSQVMSELKRHIEPDRVPNEGAPVRRCFRYMDNRPGQFDYPSAIAANLPVGSGEVESAHRYIIQTRLKVPGAWWLPDNAQAMLNLRVLRANHRWDDYWDQRAAA